MRVPCVSHGLGPPRAARTPRPLQYGRELREPATDVHRLTYAIESHAAERAMPAQTGELILLTLRLSPEALITVIVFMNRIDHRSALPMS